VGDFSYAPLGDIGVDPESRRSRAGAGSSVEGDFPPLFQVQFFDVADVAERGANDKDDAGWTILSAARKRVTSWA